MELLSAICELLESDIIFWSVIEAFLRSLIILANIPQNTLFIRNRIQTFNWRSTFNVWIETDVMMLLEISIKMEICFLMSYRNLSNLIDHIVL